MDSWSVAIVIVATLAQTLVVFSNHCFTRCQGYKQGDLELKESKDSRINMFQ